MYPLENLDEYDDNGTMPENVEELASHIVGHRIVSANVETHSVDHLGFSENVTGLVLTLDNGKRVKMIDTSDCCAYTDLEKFWLDPSKVEHAITGIGTTEGYTKWHIYADLGDVMQLDVSWSSGNPFYYGYGFEIKVLELD